MAAAATALFYSLILVLLSLATTPVSSQLSSSISVSPSTHPTIPFISLAPALPPDVMPVFPSPKRGTGSSPEGALPTIPSSPSPPNPDSVEPHSAAAPLGSGPVSSAVMGSFVNLIAGVLVMESMWLLDVYLVAGF